MGRDLNSPEVVLGYEVNHWLDDHGDMDQAIQCICDDLPSLLEACRSTVAGVLG